MLPAIPSWRKSSLAKQNKVRGLTLIEMLISLAIVAGLLTALAVAINASAMNYKENEDIFKTVNMARQALLRITSQIRTGFVDANNIADESACGILCADDSLVRYHYDSVNDKLYLYDYTTAADYLLCENVTAMSFKKDNSGPTAPEVKSVRILITVDSGKTQQQLAAAAVVRRILAH